MKFLDNKVFFGIVEENKDPNRRGRIKARVQSVFDDIPLEDIPWASPSVSLDGKSYNVPAIGKVVSVVFAWGDQYQPYYIYSNYYNVNLQNKLNSLSDEESAGFSAIVYDHQTQMWIDSKTFNLDFMFNKITLNKSNINLELKDNDGKITFGAKDGDQPIILGKNFLEWFDKFVNELIKPDSLIASSPVVKPELDSILTEYKIIKDTFLSKNVYVNDNDKIKKLERNPKTNTTVNDSDVVINNKSLQENEDDDLGLVPNGLTNNITSENQKSSIDIKKTTPVDISFGIDNPKYNFVDLWKSSTGSPEDAATQKAELTTDEEEALQEISMDNLELPDGVDTETIVDYAQYQTDLGETELGTEYPEEDGEFVFTGSGNISSPQTTTEKAFYSNQGTQTISGDLLSSGFIKQGYGGQYVCKWLAYDNMMQFMKDLEDFLKKQPNLKHFLGVASLGVGRSLSDTLKGANQPNKTVHSKHCVGLAIDMYIDTTKLNEIVRNGFNKHFRGWNTVDFKGDKTLLTTQQGPDMVINGKKIRGGGFARLGYRMADEFLHEDNDLKVAIQKYCDSYQGNLGKRFKIRWGGSWGTIVNDTKMKGTLAEFHHFEITDDTMGQFFEPYRQALASANLQIPTKSNQLGPMYYQFKNMGYA